MQQITLHEVSRSDAAELIRGNNESRGYHEPWAYPFLDKAGFEEWFGSLLLGANVGLVARCVEPGGAPGGIVGVVNISQIFLKGFRSAYLGYYGMAAYGGRGLMTEAVRLATQFGFHEIGLHRLEANIQPDNTRSLALVRRLGFRHEGFSPRYLQIHGEWRDHERWALLAEDTVR